jgi:hypothetical protein
VFGAKCWVYIDAASRLKMQDHPGPRLPAVRDDIAGASCPRTWREGVVPVSNLASISS